ncbi:MAG: hypothetical protein HYX36_08200 [Rhizobiales bacterium]|nr:hypothetical protein [Hyphomicrobiales bacterium]
MRTAFTRPAAEGDPLTSLAAAVLAALPELRTVPLAYTQAGLQDSFRDSPEQAAQPVRQGLLAASGAGESSAAGEARLLLVIDQLEELFTNQDIDAANRERFVLVLEALAKSGLVWVVATLRSDFFDRLDQVPSLVRLSDRARYLLLPPNEAEIRQIVRQPAREAGLHFETDARTGESLDETIVAATESNPGSLPLLEYLLDQLWRRREDDTLSFEAYKNLGGLEGAIGARAGEVLAAQPADVQAELPRLLRALVTVGQGAEAAATARHADLDRFASGTSVRRLVDALLSPEARLLVTDRTEAGGVTIRVAHEALLRHWPRAQTQIASDRTDLQLIARLEEAQTRWRVANEDVRDDLLLPSGLPVAEAKDLAGRRGDELSRDVADYISRSAAADDARQAARLRDAQELTDQQVVASVARAYRVMFIDPLKSVDEARTALAAKETPEARQALQTAMEVGLRRRDSRNDERAMLGRGPSFLMGRWRQGKMFSRLRSDGRYTLVASERGQDGPKPPGTVYLIDMETLETRQLEPGEQASGRRLEFMGFSLKGGEIFVARQFYLDIHDLAANRIKSVQLEFHAKPTHLIAGMFGSYVLVGDTAGHVMLADTVSDARPQLGRGRGAALFIEGNVNGNRAIVIFESGQAQLVIIDDPRSPIVCELDMADVMGAAFDPGLDADRFVATTRTGEIAVWQIASRTATRIASFNHGQTAVQLAGFSGDGSRVISLGDDGTCKIWNIRTQSLVASYG